MSYLACSRQVATSNLPAVPVPNDAGAVPLQADDIVVWVVVYDATAPAFDPGDPPTGFVELGEVDLAGPDGHTAWVGYKRLTGADTGTYTFAGSIGSSGKYLSIAVSFRGRHATNNPEIGTPGSNTSSNASPVTVTADGLTLLAGDDVIFVSVPDVTATDVWTSFTPPTGYTVRTNVGDGVVSEFESGFHQASVAVKENASAGATGSVSGTVTLTGSAAGWIAYHIRIPSASGGGGGTVNAFTGKFGGLLRGKLG
jgi:hypothetical protein